MEFIMTAAATALFGLTGYLYVLCALQLADVGRFYVSQFMWLCAASLWAAMVGLPYWVLSSLP